MPRLLIVIASTRPGRVGLPVGEWFAGFARSDGRFDVEMVDLSELALPLLDEPHHPRLRNYTKDHTKGWSATVAAADVIVFVTAEYNYGYPAALKNAIDYLNQEWRHKALGYVSYGGIAAGTRAVQQLKQVGQAVGLVSAQLIVNIAFVASKITENGSFDADDDNNQAATAMLGELLLLDGALRTLR
jgi:NAD(P)H-dependent FMN reductase